MSSFFKAIGRGLRSAIVGAACGIWLALKWIGSTTKRIVLAIFASAVVVFVVVPILMGMVAGIGTEWGKFFCPGCFPPPPAEPRAISIPLSTTARKPCQLGRIERIFRQELFPKLSIGEEAQRLVICADNTVSGTDDDIFTKFADRFSDCARYEADTQSLEMAEDSQSICRAPLKFGPSGSVVEADTIREWMYVCVPGGTVTTTDNPALADQSIKECSPETLKTYSFL